MTVYTRRERRAFFYFSTSGTGRVATAGTKYCARLNTSRALHRSRDEENFSTASRRRVLNSGRMTHRALENVLQSAQQHSRVRDKKKRIDPHVEAVISLAKFFGRISKHTAILALSWSVYIRIWFVLETILYCFNKTYKKFFFFQCIVENGISIRAVNVSFILRDFPYRR